MGKKSQPEPSTDDQMNNPDLPPRAETETASETVPIDEVELMRIRVSALARDLTPWELISTLDVKGLNSSGRNDTLTDRLTRAELRRVHGDGAAEWDPQVDEREGIPRTISGWREELSVDEIIEELRSARLNTSHNVMRTGRSAIRTDLMPRDQGGRREMNTQPAGGANEFDLSNRFVNRPTLPSGQSMGWFQDPISFNQSDHESGINDRPPHYLVAPPSQIEVEHLRWFLRMVINCPPVQ